MISRYQGSSPPLTRPWKVSPGAATRAMASDLSPASFSVVIAGIADMGPIASSWPLRPLRAYDEPTRHRLTRDRRCETHYDRHSLGSFQRSRCHPHPIGQKAVIGRITNVGPPARAAHSDSLCAIRDAHESGPAVRSASLLERRGFEPPVSSD